MGYLEENNRVVCDQRDNSFHIWYEIWKIDNSRYSSIILIHVNVNVRCFLGGRRRILSDFEHRVSQADICQSGFRICCHIVWSAATAYHLWTPKGAFSYIHHLTIRQYKCFLLVQKFLNYFAPIFVWWVELLSVELFLITGDFNLTLMFKPVTK